MRALCILRPQELALASSPQVDLSRNSHVGRPPGSELLTSHIAHHTSHIASAIRPDVRPAHRVAAGRCARLARQGHCRKGDMSDASPLVHLKVNSCLAPCPAPSIWKWFSLPSEHTVPSRTAHQTRCLRSLILRPTESNRGKMKKKIDR